MSPSPWKNRLTQLYTGSSPAAVHFRFGIVLFDLATLLFFVVSSLFEPNLYIYAIDYLIALVLACDFFARLSITENRKFFWRKLETWLDVVIILSLLASVVTTNLSFLRIFRTLRLLRSRRVLRDVSERYPWFRRHQDIVASVFNLIIFIFFISACVYVVEHGVNDKINNYMDALYFTVTTLTTTGFGDITMTGALGRGLAVVIMIIGVGLFLRLAQTIFQPPKVRFPCPDCGLINHDQDAVHCKHCGRVLNIPSDGY